MAFQAAYFIQIDGGDIPNSSLLPFIMSGTVSLSTDSLKTMQFGAKPTDKRKKKGLNHGFQLIERLKKFLISLV